MGSWRNALPPGVSPERTRHDLVVLLTCWVKSSS